MNIVDKYCEQAQEELKALTGKLPLTSVILDNWGGAVRFVYGADFVSSCNSKCEECPLFKTVGVDASELKRESFVTTLRPASEAALEVFPSKQKFLNCKTMEQYLGAIIAWLVERCRDNDSIAAELELAKGFRILYSKGFQDLSLLEKESKRHVVEEALRRMDADDSRKGFLASYARQIGLV